MEGDSQELDSQDGRKRWKLRMDPQRAETHGTLLTLAHGEASVTILSELQPPDHCGSKCQNAVETARERAGVVGQESAE